MASSQATVVRHLNHLGLQSGSNPVCFQAYVQYKNDESMKKAMEWNNTWYKGSNITVEKLGEFVHPNP